MTAKGSRGENHVDSSQLVVGADRLRGSEGCPCWLLLLLSPVLLLISPLLVLEAIVLFLCNVALFPLSTALVKTPGAEGRFDRGSLPSQRPVPEPLADKMKPVTAGCCCCKETFVACAGMSAEESVKATCAIMLAVNVVSTTSTCPEDLTGIFWMKGNSVPEELACLSYAVCSEAARPGVMVTVLKDCFGWTYLNSWMGKVMSAFDSNMTSRGAGIMYFLFEDEGLNHGRVYGCPGMDYGHVEGLYRMGKWTLERLPGPRVVWKRGCYWFPGWFGDRVEFGSYELVKIMSVDGERREPEYSEFVEHMATKNKGCDMMMSAPAATE